MTDPLSPTELATKQKVRNAVLTNVKKESTKAQGLLRSTPIDPKAIQVCIVKLRDYKNRLCDASVEIQGSLVGDVQDKDIENMAEWDDNLLGTIAELETTLDIFKEGSRTAGATANISSHETSRVSTSENSRVRLPKLELKYYDGDPSKWDEFWDYYDVTFHSNVDIPVIEKFTYLKLILTDAAERTISGYKLTAANYEEVIKALKQRFGDPEVAIFQHFDSMLTLSVASGDVSELQRVFDTCEAHIRSLIALGLSEDTFGRVFAPILLSKLPGNVRVELIRKKGRDAWTLAKLREFLRDEIYARDMSKRSFGNQSGAKQSVQASASSGGGKPRWNGKHSDGKRPQYTASALPSAGAAATERKPLVCAFCGDSHFNNKCKKFASAESRRQQIRGSCYSCLGSKHLSRDCENKKPCFFCKSTAHHQSLCDKRFPASKTDSNDTSATQLKVSASESTKSVTTSIMSHNGRRGVLQMAVADVSGNKGSQSARQMLDNGSDNSFINKKLAVKVGARLVGQEVVSMAGFSDRKRKQTLCDIYEFQLHLRGGGTITIQAYGVEVIICPIDKLAFDVKKFPLLDRIPLAEPLAIEDKKVNVDILLGSDYYYDIVKSERISLDDGVVLLDSHLGYIIAGRTTASSTNSVNMLLSRNPNPQTNFDLERFWNLEEIGVKQISDTHDDEVALKKFNETIQFDKSEHRYMVKWPFKTGFSELPENYGLAFGRLRSMINRNTSENDLINKCQAIFDDQLQKNIIEEAPMVPDGDMVHYLPHQAVITPQKTTTKVRVVYDASSKPSKAVASLNDCLYRGPVLLEDLCGLLLRFRLEKVGVTSDIEKAFLQVGLQKEDRDVARFLWLRDTTKPCTKNNLIHYRFRRVCFGAISSPFLLGGTLTYHLSKVGTPVATRILTNLYVDNVLDSLKSTDSAIQYYNEATTMFNDISMNLREWHSNDQDFMATVPEHHRGSQVGTKVLGLHWDLAADTLGCPVEGLKCADVVTKRSVLQAVAKVYDPCGYYTPVTSPAKWFIRDLWKKEYDWDTELSEDLIAVWKPILSNLQKLHQCTIPRRCVSLPIYECQISLHAFCDASAKAYCAVVYLVAKHASGEVESSMIFSKCRVSPLTQQSIPRLELLAATIGARLIQFVSEHLRIEVAAKYIWSDSQCVLHWIASKSVSTVFVRNRVTEILKVPDVTFRYVPTNDNPADIPTRGFNYDEIVGSGLWWKGPSWLTNATLWPANPIGTDSEADSSMFNESLCNNTSPVCAAATVTEGHGFLFDVSRVSKLSKLLRITAWVLRFVKNCRLAVGTKAQRNLRSKKKHLNEGAEPVNVLLASEIMTAKLVWEREVQRQHFPGVASNPEAGIGTVKSLGPLCLNSDGIICCRNRLANADILGSTKTPKLLPKNDPYTRLVVREYHEMFNHSGPKQTLAELRCEYWIINGRTEVKRVRRECLICQRLKGGPFRVPSPPDLPGFRGTKAAPFSSVGLDYLGPLIVTERDTGEKKKVWVCLFTCPVIRAVHLEVVGSMDAERFLLCFQRFIAFYRCPSLVVSDNARQFDLSRRVLQKMWSDACRSQLVQDFSASKNISWKFIPESAPWMGGFYERLVGVVKSSLKAAVFQKTLDFVELQTVIYEVAAIVNSRPLVYSEDEVGDEPLTPSHLLMRHRTITPFEISTDIDDATGSSSDKLIKGWKRLHNVLDGFWSNWQKQYLLSLQEYFRVQKQRNTIQAHPRVGEVVMIGEKLLPRMQWRIGRISELIPSADGRVRSAKIRFANGRFVNRPIKLLYPIEVRN